MSVFEVLPPSFPFPRANILQKDDSTKGDKEKDDEKGSKLTGRMIDVTNVIKRREEVIIHCIQRLGRKMNTT